MNAFRLSPDHTKSVGGGVDRDEESKGQLPLLDAYTNLLGIQKLTITKITSNHIRFVSFTMCNTTKVRLKTTWCTFFLFLLYHKSIIISQQSQRNMFHLYCICKTDNSPIVDSIKSFGLFMEFFIKHWFWKLKNYVNDFTLQSFAIICKFCLKNVCYPQFLK